ncbi:MULTISPECIES: acyltransferase [Bradyrhizobium]|uniref:Acyltransferase n=1 Tax=Bradyrhizobium zhanjiangense TaxID=1325107 RepID=A0A4Q0QMJ9_9BRAD|nr:MULTISPECIES: acyltransferase [Bradyrhizobium]RXG95957.1 acyltransferase [Bradyrhizobium zhanjiangense]RXG97497.1 acyltransferase [Bradyrhizobium zhanjiangense]RXH34748.1 acyltransferase [Bradyrhizobium zhanjiangense]UQR60503.1 acyltransferase [Bradyrhizobium sp. C-145]
MRGTPKTISLRRRLICDLMRASMGVPFVSLSRSLDIRPLLESRAGAMAPAGWAAMFVKAFALVAKDEPILRTVYAKWPWPSLYELPKSVALVAIARVERGEECVMPQRISAPEALPLGQIDAEIRRAKTAPVEDVPMFRKIMRATRLPLPLRRLSWAVGLNFGRQRGNWFGSFAVSSVAAYGGGELHPITPGPFVISYGVVEADQTIHVVIRWDHRVTDAAPIARVLTRLEQVLNTEIAAELRAAGAKPIRAVRT